MGMVDCYRQQRQKRQKDQCRFTIAYSRGLDINSPIAPQLPSTSWPPYNRHRQRSRRTKVERRTRVVRATQHRCRPLPIKASGSTVSSSRPASRFNSCSSRGPRRGPAPATRRRWTPMTMAAAGPMQLSRRRPALRSARFALTASALCSHGMLRLPPALMLLLK